MSIRQLPESLANKIAAGEVVERPASVVKELVENSIDANSNHIKIHLEEAGLTEIKVTDNGDGIIREDVKKAFLRHATSKISFDEDLFHIKSLGFRGEALASIASVSKLEIKTSQGNEAGIMLELDGGEVVKETLSDARKGTEITVKQLFYNTPARLKYMKSIHTELGHITDLINRYALAHTTIRFEVYHNGNSIFMSNGSGNMLQVINQIYGRQVARSMVEINGETDDFLLNGFISKPDMTRASRQYITIIVNGRYIRNQPLNYAILRAYDTLLPRHRFPIVVLSIQVDPILVDVNVHPTKLEVRFSKEKELVNVIERLIQQTFQQMTLIPEAIQHQRKQKQQIEQRELDLEPSVKHVSRERKVEQAETDKNINYKVKSHSADFIPSYQEQPDHVTENLSVDQHNHQAQVGNRIPPLYPIGQYRGTYILAQNDEGFYMIDQHAAQERIKYEYFKEKLAQPETDLQQLLFPLTFEFTKNESLFVENHFEQLKNVGLLLEPFGEHSYAIRSYPRWFPNGMEEDIIRDMVEQIIHDGTVNISKLREEVAILLSCKRSIKANHYLNENEMNRLLEDLRKTVDPFTCPHGRPVIIHFTNQEIEKMFKRIM